MQWTHETNNNYNDAMREVLVIIRKSNMYISHHVNPVHELGSPRRLTKNLSISTEIYAGPFAPTLYIIFHILSSLQSRYTKFIVRKNNKLQLMEIDTSRTL